MADRNWQWERESRKSIISVCLDDYTASSSSSSSSSSYHAANTDLTDPLSLLVSIVYSFREVFRATSCIGTELLYIGSSWSSNICSSLWSVPLKYVAYESVLTSPAVFCMSGSSNLDNFRDGWLVSIQLLLCRGFSPGLVLSSLQPSCVIAINLFLHTFRKGPCGVSIRQLLGKKLCFILSVRSALCMTDSLSTSVHVLASCMLM